MTFVWRAAEALTIGAAVVLGGAAAAVGAAWLLSRIARRFGTDPTPMGTTRQTFDKLPAALVDDLRARAEERRVRADARHTDAHAIETGESTDRSFKLMKYR